jgi:hypothetical protein
LTSWKRIVKPLRLGHLLVVASVILLLAAACRASPSKGQWFGSDSLLINLELLKRVQEVRYSEGDTHWVLRPSDSKNELVVVRLDVRNRAAAQVFMTIGSETVIIRGDKTGNYPEYKALDPFGQRTQMDSKSPQEDAYVPFLWGAVELPQECPTATGELQTCRLYGWVVFEVLKGTKFTQMQWRTGDTVFMNF